MSVQGENFKNLLLQRKLFDSKSGVSNEALSAPVGQTETQNRIELLEKRLKARDEAKKRFIEKQEAANKKPESIKVTFEKESNQKIDQEKVVLEKLKLDDQEKSGTKLRRRETFRDLPSRLRKDELNGKNDSTKLKDTDEGISKIADARVKNVEVCKNCKCPLRRSHSFNDVNYSLYSPKRDPYSFMSPVSPSPYLPSVYSPLSYTPSPYSPSWFVPPNAHLPSKPYYAPLLSPVPYNHNLTPTIPGNSYTNVSNNICFNYFYESNEDMARNRSSRETSFHDVRDQPRRIRKDSPSPVHANSRLNQIHNRARYPTPLSNRNSGSLSYLV
jgi:hypothetical protein